MKFNTSRTDRWKTDSRRCHINWVILDSDWEGEFCRVAESHPRVRAYVKNHNLGFEVPYRFGSENRRYRPDFIVLVDDGRGENDLLHLVVEIKGYRREDAKEKKTTMDIRRDTEDGCGPWKGRINPASGNPLTEELCHGMIGRDLPARQRQRGGFRRRIPRTLPKVLEPTAIQKLIDSAGSYRDKAILILLSRVGQRIGDWSPIAGRHGILGMELEDVDRKRRFITVRLKGARDQHRVPVTDDFWPIYEKYLRTERRAAPDVQAVWIASRKGQGKPLRYASFESALRYIGRKAGISVHPHLFRHTLAQGVLEATGNIKVAQEILGHSHLSTTADLYLRVDQHAMVTALERAKANTGRAKKHHSWPSAKAAQYVFEYDDRTISELERTIAQASGVEPTGGDS